MAKVSAKYEVLYIIDPDLGEEGIVLFLMEYLEVTRTKGSLNK